MTSLIRAPVAQSVVSSRRSRSVAAASIIAPISSGASPSGGCQRLLVGLTERGLAVEFDTTRVDADGSAKLEPVDWRPFTAVEFNIPIGRLNSPALHFKPGLWHRTIVFHGVAIWTVPRRRSRRGSLQTGSTW